MSEIVGMVGMSHSPFATMLPLPSADAPGGRFLADAARVAAAVAALAADVLVVIGPDHFHANFYDVMPPFVLGVAEAEAFGDFGSRRGPLPVAPALAWSTATRSRPRVTYTPATRARRSVPPRSMCTTASPGATWPRAMRPIVRRP